VVVGVDAAGVRREVGPLAWCVLEVLAAAPVVDGDVVAASVRSLAVELGVSKNTIQRSMAALVAAGLVEHEQRRARDGRLERGGYRVSVSTSVLRPVDAVGAAAVVGSARSGSRRRAAVAGDAMLSLFAGK
jgi:DNA-binding transcriptional MocR family regulator